LKRNICPNHRLVAEEARQLFHVDFNALTVDAIETAFFAALLLIALGYTRGLRHPVMLASGALTRPPGPDPRSEAISPAATVPVPPSGPLR
jgi:hypothetical protein